MNKQLIQGIINVGNKDIESSPVKYTVETKDMNKTLVISVLMAYQVVNDSSLTIVTDENVFNDCYVLNLAIDHVCIDSNKGQISIELDDIISIQFTDKRAVVGMK